MSAISVSLNLRGWERLERGLLAAPEQTRRAVGASLYKAATKVFNESQNQVPVKRGILRATGFVSPVINFGANSMGVRIAYGGAAAPYAWDQHYNLSYRHVPGRKALFLSDPVMAVQPNLERWVLSDVGKALSGLGF